jgi:hypothetical protein
VLLRALYEDSDSRSSISSSKVVARKSRSRGDDSSSYVVPDDATVIFIQRFRCILAGFEALDLTVERS